MTELYSVTAVRNMSSPTSTRYLGSNRTRVEAASLATPNSKYQYFCSAWTVAGAVLINAAVA